MACRVPRLMVQRIPASARDLAAQRAAFRRVSALSDTDLALLPPPQRAQLPPGCIFLRAGERARETALVLEGGLREYYPLADGGERTRNFNLPGEFAGSLSDLMSGEPARTSVVAVAPTVLLVTPWNEYRRLTETHPAWMRFAREVAERLYAVKAQREYELLALDAAARYRATLARWPGLEALFTQRDIASYIGITPVHLSRLRAAARKKKS